MTQNIDNKIMRKTMTAGMLRLCMLFIVLATGSALVMAEGGGVRIGGSVYGGGNLAPVEGDAAVIMSTGTVAGNVFGGGKGKADNFTCDKAMVGINNDGVTGTGTTADPYILKEGGTTVTITNGTVEGDVYGGGEVGRVERNTIVTIGEAGNSTLTPIVKGHVFGAGQGVETHGYSALVRGNVTVTIQGKAEVWQNVHGGGEKASVGRYEVATTQALADQYHIRIGMPCFLKAGGKCTVNIQDEAVIGKDDIADSGDVFGAGQGVTPIYNNEIGDVNRSKRMVTKTDGDGHNDNNHDSWDYYEDEDGNVDYSYVWEYFATEADYLQYVETLGRASATDVVIGGKRGEPEVGQTVGTITASSDAPTVKGTVYGGSESGFVYYSTEVNIEKGTVNQDVFGGGKGLASFAEAGRVRINTNLKIDGGIVKGNVYGGGSLGDVGNIVKNTTDYNYKWKKNDGSNSFNDPHNNTISGTNNNTGICKVEITGGTIGLENTSKPDEHGNVFGAGKGKGDSYYCEKAMAYASNVTIKNSGTVVYGTVYGGGEVGRVEDDAKVIIGTENGTDEPDIKGDVFGAGAGLDTHGYSALVRGNSLVTVQGKSKVGGSVYGGGKSASVGRFEVVGGLPTSPKSGGICTVTIQDDAEIETNVYGACKGVTPAFVSGESKSMQTYENRGSSWEYYDENGKEDHRYVWKKYTAENDYLGFLRTLALTSNPYVTISENATVNGSVFGGGEMGITLGKVVVDILGGTVTTDVYGGGALADTNTANWENGALVSSYPYHQETSISRPSYIKTEVAVGGSVAGLYTRSGDSEPYTYTATGENDTALSGIDYYQLVPGASTTGLYTRTGTEGNYTYTEITDADATADATTDYFALYNTTVNLLSGTVKGDAYGGGLGRIGVAAANAVYYTQEEANAYNTEHNLSSGDVGFVTIETIKTPAVTGVDAVEAKVYGEITVQLGDAGLTDATQFNITEYDGKDIVKSGRVFGCNNLNGSPQGNVKVDVWKTVTRFDNIARTAITRNATTGKVETVAEPHIYDVAAVYGGGNLANYTASGKKTNVIIETCEVSVESVYGGGNAAAVPETDVLVKGAYQIESVFGGGNGRDQYTLDNGTSWENNPGANVNGNANTLLTGGLIHEAYGGSNKKGTITGNVTIDLGEGGDCVLDVGKVVAAGKNADVEGDLVVIMGCKTSRVPLLFAGADDANVNGNVELTITSGSFGKVFGGNNAGGVIRGHIKLNIEETSTCDPIIIDELYLGGNQALYSQYGYYLGTDGETYLPITEAMTSLHEGDEGYHIAATGRIATPYAAPELNITSCTRIDKVFGGGYGTGATIYGNPVVNINMIQGYHHENVPSVMSALSLNASENPNNLGIIGDVYGGGNAANIEGNPTVNIGTESTVTLHTKINSVSVIGVADYELSEENVLGAYIRGNVFGGGMGEAKTTVGTAGEAFLCAKAMVNGNVGTHVNIGNGFVRGNVYGGGEVGRVEHNTAVKIGLDDNDIPDGKTSAPVIKGNVFGAGKGTNTHGYSALVRGNSTVTVQADAKVSSSVYGGGEIASVGKYRVEDGLPVALAPDNVHPNSGYCYVNILGNAEIGPNDMEMTKTGGPSDAGHVFGAGKGVLPYENADAEPFHMNGTQHLDEGGDWDGKSWDDAPTRYPAYDSNNELDATYVEFIKSLALATQTVVTISGNPFIKGSVYGGSENGYVQQDTRVVISGGQIGNGYVQMADDGTYLSAKRSVNRRYTAKEWSDGRLFADSDPDYTAGTDTELESLVSTGGYYTSSLPECASWPYGQAANAADRYAPYDPNANASGYYDNENTKSAEGGRPTGDDGHTFFGSVFGGGSGYYPYKPGRWFEDAGAVYGNTTVEITGGHILTSVYGGNEMTDVGKYKLDDDGKPTTKVLSGGKCTITMSGGTLGVPRTLKQIGAHPVTCYLFGAGKGDQRVFFNKSTNVGDVEVNITGGTIYGSVFGGGEDGHVLRDVKVTIGQQTTTGEGAQASTTVTGPTIGTWGTSYVDGNVFGGGRGFSGDAYTAGNVAGSVKMEIKGGNILGSIYGGGRLGSVGYGLFEATNTANYGVMQDDDTDDNGQNTNYYKEGAVGLGRGHIDITISGGTIGNNREYIIPNATNMAAANIPAEDRDISKWDDVNKYWDTWKEYHKIPKTEFDTTTGRLTHTKGGNVFAGGMGNFYKQDGSTPISDVNWWQLGCAKSTKLTITGGTIMSCVYGGGELGQVVGYHTTDNVNLGSEITIQGSNTVIGTEVKDGSNVTQYTFGSVFGGGYGSLKEKITHTGGKPDSYPKYIAGRVKAGTKVNMTAGRVWACVYGGGEMAAVGESKTLDETLTTGFTGDTHVIISGGKSGKEKVGSTYFGGAKMGHVYGGGSGHNNTVRSGHVYGNTNVTISAGSVSGEPNIYHNVYGGGAYGSVGDFTYQTGTDAQTGTQKVIGISGLNENHSNSGVATVTITGGTIGYDGKDNGMVFGSSRGDINQPGKRDDHTAWVYNTYVNIGTAATGTPGQQGYVAESGPSIKGTVYGSGENGHVFNNTVVTINGGTIGIDDSTDPGYTVVSNGTAYSGAAYPYRGNVYGGGCGTDMYYSGSIPTGHTYNDGEGDTYNSLAGIVYGNSTVNITGGRVVRNVYGAGAMGSVGKITTTEGVTTIPPSGGLTTINISGGTVGVDGNDNGNVFGAARGDATTNQIDCALVKNTGVTISGSADIKGSVYGGGETGDVHDNTSVTMSGGTVGHNVFGGGKGSSHNFTCDKAMVGVVEQGVTTTGSGDNITYTLLDGGTTVEITAGTVNGNVYGGGEIARVERNTAVTIGADGGTGTPIVKGSVFGAGAGLDTHGYSALVRGHSSVTVQGSAQVWKNVYGGGELASVGRYKVKISEGNPTDAPADLPSGMPYGLKAGGTSTVIIQGSATIGTVNDALTGHVYGAGQGVEPRNYDYLTKEQFDAISENAGKTYNIDEHQPKRMIGNNTWEHFGSRSAYLQFIETLAISAATDVTIGGGTVKGSVFGGSESGFVYRSTDVKIQGGTVEGDAFGGGRGLESFAEAGRVRWNTKLAVSGGAVEGNVYGGGNMGDVGTIYKPADSHDYVWKNSDSNGNNLDTGNNNRHNNNLITDTNKNTGICTVAISGGTIGIDNLADATKHGNVFGAGRGMADTWWCEKAIVYATDVIVSKGTVKGNVYGGGEVGRVEDDSKVTIGDPSVTDNLLIRGSVFGAGAGLATHGYSALVRGNSDVVVQGKAQIEGSVYGGGEIASVGRFTVPNGLPKEPLNGGTCTVKIQNDAKIGLSGKTHHVFGACKGVTPTYNNDPNDPNRSKSLQLRANESSYSSWSSYNNDDSSPFIWVYYETEKDYLDFLRTLALTSNTHVTIDDNSEVFGSVYGGGERGVTLGGVDVNMAGGTVHKDVYGGGSLADSNTAMWDVDKDERLTYVELPNLIVGSPATGYYSEKSPDKLITALDAKVQQNTTYYAIYKTNVNLKDGTVEGSVYGGGLGQLDREGVDGVKYTQAEIEVAHEGDPAYGKSILDWKVEPVEAQSAIPAKVYGDVLVKLNETTATDNCVVKGKIFGCNNLNGSPQSAVTVHIYKTADYTGHEKDESKSNTKYNVEAVYGGGNLAAFIPDYKAVADTAVVRVIIDGCDQTSIKTVYGGGNAASVPATEVTVNGTYEIGQVFGGGNGYDDYELDGKWYDNPGANVGLKNYTHLGTGAGTDSDPILAVNNTDPDASTRNSREANYGYGIGKSHATIYGGTVHEVYGGSNSRGNVRVESRTTLEDRGCNFTVGEAYGGGNNAPQDGDAILEIGCISGLDKAYGGASNADVNGDVVLNITNGTYDQVFGGNDAGGAIRGSITVNIEETGCNPIIIGELYGGGCNAAYSVYGYGANNKPLKAGEDGANPTPVRDPVVNVKSFTSIGNIYGGGYGVTATMVGSPEVNINVVKGKYSHQTSEQMFTNRGFVLEDDPNITGKKRYSKEIDKNGTPHTVYVPAHDKDAIGAIYNVFGGGNAADVIGTPHVYIGTLTGEVISLVTKPIADSEGTDPTDEGWTSYELAKAEGIDIRGNVFGGGNAADVTGDTEVVIGKNNSVKTYSFTSYNAASDGTAWSSGLAQTTGATETINNEKYAEVVILTNGKYGEYVGKKFYVNPEGTGRLQLYDANKAATSLWVDIKTFELKTYSFTSYGAENGGSPYSTGGTATATGNFKTFSGQEYMQIVVLTNPGYDEWVGRTFYVTTAEQTGDNLRRRLYKATGEPVDVWVTITKTE
ncbi:MAG: hypothetical protein IJ887_04855 [Prevotella sp.]|nr:hypothetical protein [Prevotella sp.]